MDDALEKLHQFSHIAFTSRNGIQMVMRQWAKHFADAQTLAAHIRSHKVQICALGADSEALECFHLSADVQPADVTAITLLLVSEKTCDCICQASTQGLVQDLRERDALEGSHILCPVPCVRGVHSQGYEC